MQYVFITAFGVGGATIIGALVGFAVGRIPAKWNSVILGFAAGIMLAAAVFGLILPSIDAVGAGGIWKTAVGIISGALFLNLADKFTPYLYGIAGVEKKQRGNVSVNNVLLFVMAIAIHNFPEGIAAGVAFGTGDIGNAVSVAVGIALQNIPEGMVIISPMIFAGVSRVRAFIIASVTGVVEIVGTFIGFFASHISEAVLPFLLAFAGGTMLYVIIDDMIPETQSNSRHFLVSCAVITGFVAMTVLNTVISQ